MANQSGSSGVWNTLGKCILDNLLFILCTWEFFSMFESKLHGYVDDYTLLAVVLSLLDGVAVAESVNRNLIRVIESCDLWGMRLNAS